MGIQQLKQLKVLVIGDYCTDIFRYGYCNRISPEAPVPVFLFEYEIKTDGMAGNVVNNLKALNIQTNLLTTSKDIQKIRYVDLKSKQHLLRTDFEKHTTEINIESHSLSNYDAIVLSDYNKGTISEKTFKMIRKKYNGYIFIDSKKRDLSIFDDKKTFLKINEQEYKLSEKLPKKSELIVTLGEKGAMYKGGIIPTKKVDVFDVSGAGDSFLSGFIAQFLLSKDILKSINFANICSSNVVKKSGTASIDFEEVKNELCF